MFTPQRKAPWTPPSSSPRTIASRFTVADKGKAVAFIDGPPPPRISLESEINCRGENVDDWKRFKDAGLLDESSMERKDRQALLDKVSKLEKELFDYQYNMGLLLIDKNDLVSKNEELQQEMAEAEEILKREQSAHLIAISEAEKREENLKKALDIEKKCLVDLERALRDMQEEQVRFKATSENSVVDVQSRMEALEEKRLDIEAKAHLADAKFAAADRKNSELDRKMEDLEVRENNIQREHLSLVKEKEAHKTYCQKQKDDLVEWEKKLQEGEQRLCDLRRVLKEREEKLTETDTSSQEKKAYLDELQQKIDSANATLKKMEDDMKKKSADLDLKEKDAESMRIELETREKQLNEKEEVLNLRERVKMASTLKEHKTMLDAEMRKFESEMKQNRESLELECQSRKHEIDQKESEIVHLEAKLGKREHALEKRSDRLKEKEKDVEAMLKSLKEEEQSLKAEAKRLESEKKNVTADTEVLEDLRNELEMWKSNLRNQELEIEEEQKKIDSLQAERSECLRLQSNLKQAFENARRQSELIEKEAEELKIEREKFEKDWEALDERRAAVDNELKILAEERASFEKLRSSEDDRLKREREEAEEHFRLESEKIRVQIETFEATMEHQKKMGDEKATNDLRRWRDDLESKRQELYSDMQKREREWGEMMQKKERDLEERRVSETQTINNLKKDAEKTKEDMEVERYRLKKEREEMELIKKQLEETRTEMSKDIEALDTLHKNMKKQRKEFANERQLFGAFLEKVKGCRNCGDLAQAFLRHDLQLSTLDGSSHLQRPSHADEGDAKDELALRELSSQISPSPAVNGIPSRFGGQMSVLRKCASIIFKSPTSKTEGCVAMESPSSAELTAHVNGSSRVVHGSSQANPRAHTYAIDECRESSRIVEDSLKIPSSNVPREEHIDTSPSVDVSITDLQEFEISDAKTGRRKPGKKRAPGVRRTNSVKAVVEDAKAILGEGSFGKTVEQLNDVTGGDVNKQDESTHAEPKLSVGARKRSRSQASRVTDGEQDLDHSEGNADSVATGGRRKRRQTSATTLLTSGQRRYNLRRHAATETATAEQASTGKPKNEGEVPGNGTDQAVENLDDTPLQSVDTAVVSGRKSNLVQVSTTRSIEFTSERVVRLHTSDDLADNNVDAAAPLENASVSEDAKSAGKTTLSEEVSENGDDPGDSSGDGDANEGGDEEEDEAEDSGDNHPGQASIGNKIWKFLSS